MPSSDDFKRIVHIKGATFTAIAQIVESGDSQTGSVFMTISPAIQASEPLFDTFLPDLDEPSLYAATPNVSVYTTRAEAAQWGGQETADYLEENLPRLIDFLDEVEAGTAVTG